MIIAHRYIIARFFTYFFMIQTVIFFLVVTIDYLGFISNFLKSGYNLLNGLGFIVMRNLGIVVMLTPVCALIAALVLFGLMRRSNELIALKTGGANGMRLITPLIFCGVILSTLVFAISETVVPKALNRASYIYTVEIKKRNIQTTHGSDIWLRNGREIIYIKHYNVQSKTLSGVSITRLANESFTPTLRISAERGAYKNGKWILTNALVHTPGISDGPSSKVVDALEEMPGVEPEDLGTVVKEASEMGFAELRRHIQKIQDDGYDATRFSVDLHAKMALPVACLLMILMGSGIAMTRDRHEGIPVSVGIGIGAAFVYWVFNSVCLSLGYGEVLPPIIAAWSADILFFSSCGLLLQEVDQ